MKWRPSKKWLKRIIATLILLIASVFWVDHHVASYSSPFCSSSLSDMPHVHVGVVLGTSPKLSSGQDNFYFKYRIKAATELYFAGVVDRILVSGDNRTVYYNEPVEMQKALIEAGIPKDHIHLDFAGLRTLDSMVRSKEVFGQDSIVVISQAFHNERAIYLARENGINAWGYNAKDVSAKMGFKTRTREYFARCKMMLDLYILGTDPRHLGEPVEIPAD
ncbi:MAG: vancomycin high temperature exclusion protein [Bacteroidetes bacterium]|nr:MAG: vancomycin high temperature exclusion protein [Bacteroidota bacterium]